MTSLELRKRSAELIRTSQEVALGSPEIVARVRAHRLYCDLLRLSASSPFRTIREAAIIDEGISSSLKGCDISDRILTCSDVPDIPVVDLRVPETALPGYPASETRSGSREEAGGMRLRPSQAAEPSDESSGEAGN